ncbi:hypothetical protein [Microbacterium sp. 2FI]|uniref:hypothetical protein n=1 Tax=Microbacterium sp. 2FI TaxID=2502193 RepID=UPI0010F5EAFA|nr:hypothetical protein [Microbacterium sp. 2FI]
MPGQVLVSKVANALMEDVSAPTIGAMPIIGSVLGMFRAALGGLWVGGRVTLTTTTVDFSPNALNRSVQSGSLDVSIPLAAIEDLRVVPGLVTNIVVITTADSVFKVRCYGARRFAAAIDSARRAAA